MLRAPVLAAVCLGWGTIPLLVAETALPPAAIAFSRVTIAATGLAVIVALVRPAGPALLAEQPVRCLVSGVVLAAHWTAMFAAFERAPADTVIFLIFLAPVAIAAIERPGRALVVALAPALAGLVLIAAPRLEGNAVGVGYAVAAAVLFVVLILLSKPLAEVYGGLRLTLLETAIAAVALAPFAATADWGRPFAGWWWLLVLGLVHTAVGTGVYLWALAQLPATEVGILGYLEPVGVVLFAWLASADEPPASTLLGGALVVVAGTLAIRSNVERPREEVAVGAPAR